MKHHCLAPRTQASPVNPRSVHSHVLGGLLLVPLVKPRHLPLPERLIRIIEGSNCDIDLVVLYALLLVAVAQPQVHEDCGIGRSLEGLVEGGETEVLDRTGWFVGPEGKPQEEGHEPECEDEAEALEAASRPGHGLR